MSVGRLMMVDGWLMVDELKCFTSRARSPSAQEDELSGFEDSARSVYMPRCLKMMNDAAFKAKYRGSPQPSIHLDNGPWLRPQVEATPTKLELKAISRQDVSPTESVVKVEVRNAGTVPALETHVNIVGTERVFYGTDNDMWLAPGEARMLEFHVQWRDAATRGAAAVTADAWNAGQKQVAVPAVR